MQEKKQCYIRTALRAFFLICKLEQQRNNIIYYDGALRLLLYSSDAGTALGASMVHLVTGLTVGGIYKAQTHTLDRQCYLSRINEKSIPFLELFYLFRNLNKNLKIITFLDGFVHCHASAKVNILQFLLPAYKPLGF